MPCHATGSAAVTRYPVRVVAQHPRCLTHILPKRMRCPNTSRQVGTTVHACPSTHPEVHMHRSRDTVTTPSGWAPTARWTRPQYPTRWYLYRGSSWVH
jgi:hypothetical protein